MIEEQKNNRSGHQWLISVDLKMVKFLVDLQSRHQVSLLYVSGIVYLTMAIECENNDL